MEGKKGKQAYYPLYLLAQIAKLILLAIITIVTIFFVNHIHHSEYFPINTVRVYGSNHLNEKETQEMILPLISHGFFNIDVENIRERLLQLPWVANLFVRRIWPGQVELTVVEKVAIANWNDQALLSQTGEIFTPKLDTYPTHLPKLKGPDGEQVAMLDYFVEINRILQPIHVKISYLELTPYKTWKVILDNGISMQIGHKEILTRLTHFVKVYPKIVGKHAADVESVDLRYPNGVAVRWKTPIKT